jgi:hypothetical protein
VPRDWDHSATANLLLRKQIVHPACPRILAVVVQATGTRCDSFAAASTVAASAVDQCRTLFPGTTFLSACRRTATAKTIQIGRSKAEIVSAIKATFQNKQLPNLESGAMAYMMSKSAYLTDEGDHNGPHLMFFTRQGQ